MDSKMYPYRKRLDLLLKFMAIDGFDRLLIEDIWKRLTSKHPKMHKMDNPSYRIQLFDKLVEDGYLVCENIDEYRITYKGLLFYKGYGYRGQKIISIIKVAFNATMILLTLLLTGLTCYVGYLQYSKEKYDYADNKEVQILSHKVLIMQAQLDSLKYSQQPVPKK